MFIEYQQRIEKILDSVLPLDSIPPVRLHQAMRYAALGGGKRIRPLLIYATGETLGGDLEVLDCVACSVELIHSYSLVHDDLPSMDNDDLRRGKLSCHKAFDEATAILVGDALHALAFEVLAIPRNAALFPILSKAIGSQGMVGGQQMDLAVVGKAVSLEELETLYRLKTGALIEASIVLVAEVCSCKETQILQRYAQAIGLAFQIQDDVLDIEGKTEVLGKPQGSDEARNKPTYPLLVGLEKSKQRVQELHDQALTALSQLPYPTDRLKQLVEWMVVRNK